MTNFKKNFSNLIKNEFKKIEILLKKIDKKIYKKILQKYIKIRMRIFYNFIHIKYNKIKGINIPKDIHDTIFSFLHYDKCNKCNLIENYDTESSIWWNSNSRWNYDIKICQPVERNHLCNYLCINRNVNKLKFEYKSLCFDCFWNAKTEESFFLFRCDKCHIRYFKNFNDNLNINHNDLLANTYNNNFDYKSGLHEQIKDELIERGNGAIFKYDYIKNKCFKICQDCFNEKLNEERPSVAMAEQLSVATAETSSPSEPPRKKRKYFHKCYYN